MKINPKTSALVILDGQNDFLTAGGALADAIQAAENGPNLKEKLNSAITAARNAGAAVMNTRITFSEGYPEAGESPYGIFAAVSETGGFIKGTWGAETAEGLDIQDSDPVFEKHGMSAFLNPDFEKTLKARGIKTLVLAGCLTDACVENTMRSAYDNGFEVYNLTDATATLDSAKHMATIESSFPLFSRAITVDMFSQSLGG